MQKLTWRDIRLGTKIQTPDGEGWIESADIRKKTINIQILDKNEVRTYKIEELTPKFGQMPAGITQEIGDIAIMFSRIEDRITDFLHFIFDLKNTKQRILLLKPLSVSNGIEMINMILKDTYSEADPTLLKWNSIYIKLKDIMTKRNNIIHGSLYSFRENLIFSNSKKINSIKIKEDTQVFSREKLEQTNEEIYAIYYDIMYFLNEVCENVKKNFNKTDKEMFD